MTKAVAIIPARSGSQGLPGKNMRMLRGKTLLQRATETCVDAACVSELPGFEVYVSSDSQAILDHAHKFGAGEILRPEELARPGTTSKEVIDHAIGWLRGVEESEPDIICMVQCTTPGLTVKDIFSAVRMIHERDYDSAVTGTVSIGNQWRFDGGEVLPLSAQRIERFGRDKERKIFQENGALYAFDVEKYQEKGHRFPRRTHGIIMNPEQSVDIDTPFDLACAEAGLSAWNDRSYRNALPDKIELLVLDHDGVLTDGTVTISAGHGEAYNYYTPDGHGIGLLKQAGVEVVVASSQREGPVDKRCRQLDVPYVCKREDKITALEDWMFRCVHDWESTVYLGNDVNDMPGIRKAEASFCPSDAHRDVRQAVDAVIDIPGGKGVVRKLCDTILEKKDAHNCAT